MSTILDSSRLLQDVVDLTNLQRQVLHTTSSVGKPKTESAEATIRALNPDVKVVPHAVPLTSDNALEIARPYDIIIDGTDNFPTRYLVNDACVLLGKPDVYGSIHRFDGQVSVFWAERGPCYRCLYRDPPPPERSSRASAWQGARCSSRGCGATYASAPGDPC